MSEAVGQPATRINVPPRFRRAKYERPVGPRAEVDASVYGEGAVRIVNYLDSLGWGTFDWAIAHNCGLPLDETRTLLGRLSNDRVVYSQSDEHVTWWSVPREPKRYGGSIGTSTLAGLAAPADTSREAANEVTANVEEGLLEERGATNEARELRVKVRPEQYQLLHSVKVLRGEGISDIVARALGEYFDIGAPEIPQISPKQGQYAQADGDIKDGVKIDGPTDTVKEIKTILPREFIVKLHSLKVLRGREISKTVSRALDLHFARRKIEFDALPTRADVTPSNAFETPAQKAETTQ